MNERWRSLKEQYEKLKDFGGNPRENGFNTTVYNPFGNSCIDFTWNALHRVGISDRKEALIGGHFEGKLNVMSNIEEFKKIPNVIPGSPLNQTIERPLPKISPYSPFHLKVENDLKEHDDFKDDNTIQTAKEEDELFERLYQASLSSDPSAMREATATVYDSEFGQKFRQEVREEVDRMEQILAEQKLEEAQNIAMEQQQPSIRNECRARNQRNH